LFYPSGVCDVSAFGRSGAAICCAPDIGVLQIGRGLTARHETSPQPSQNAQAWLACRSATHICALPVAAIVETMRPLPFEPFPKAPPFVSGIAIIRGIPTPVVDMRALMGEPPSADHNREATGRFVTVKINARTVALAFDAVQGIHTLDASRVIGLPPLLQNVVGEMISGPKRS